MSATAPRSVLVVEEHAHWPNGHFPVRCAQLASAYAELGYRVELLTSEGWSRDREHAQPPFTVRRYRALARRLRRLAVHGQERHPALAHVLGTVLLVGEARACARRMVPAPDAVVVLAWETAPALVALLADRRRWLVNHFRSPDLPRIGGARTSRILAIVARWTEARRRARGGCVRLVVASEERCGEWRAEVPYLDPVVAPIAGARDVEPLADARRRLGLPADRRLALLFGEPVLKGRELVLDAFQHLPEWTLVVGGPVADGVDDGPICFPGVVDDVTRDLLFSAVDLVVLAFAPRYRNDSGTLMDAISFGVPVVCPDDAAVAALVRRYQLGTRFENGDVRSLAAAVRHAPAALDRRELHAARVALSNRSIARRQLLAVGILAGSAD
jgi:glycosyltransferase involved in cell wall biosynthesis